MALFRKHHSFLFFFFTIIFYLLNYSKICKSEKSHHPNNNTNVSPFFIFGDSFLDAGNNNYINTTNLDKANFRPYGKTYFGYPTGRFSDGRLVSDFLAIYAKLPLIQPFLQPSNSRYYYGVNFASAGAGALAETFKGYVINLSTQLNYFKMVESSMKNKLGYNEAKTRISRGVYMFSIGSNDYMSPFLINSTFLNSFSHSTYIDMVIGNLTNVIQEIYKVGGRKFGFMNLPDLGSLPGMRIMGEKNRKEASKLAKLHNKSLYNLMSKLEKQLVDFKYSLFDFNTALKQRVNHPSKYGFKEGRTACCGTGKYRGILSCGGKRPVKEFELCEDSSKYVFWDSFHLAEKAYNQFAYIMWIGGNKSHVIGPYSFKNLFQMS